MSGNNEGIDVLAKVDAISNDLAQDQLQINAKKQALLDAFNDLVNTISQAQSNESRIDDLKKEAEAAGIEPGLISTVIESRQKIMSRLKGVTDFVVKEGRGRPTISEKAITDAIAAADAAARGISVKAAAELNQAKAAPEAAPEQSAPNEVTADAKAVNATVKVTDPVVEPGPETKAAEEAPAVEVPKEVLTTIDDIQDAPSATVEHIEAEMVERKDAPVVESSNVVDAEEASADVDTVDPDTAFDDALNDIDPAVFDTEGQFDPEAERENAEEGLDPSDIAEIEDAMGADEGFGNQFGTNDFHTDFGIPREKPETVDPVAAAAAAMSEQIGDLAPNENVTAYETEMSI